FPPFLQAVAATAPERLRAGVLGQGASLPGELLAPLARNKSPSVTKIIFLIFFYSLASLQISAEVLRENSGEEKHCLRGL
ncbi:MAG: hypothetical protein ACK55Z_27685, partial [bacterium]